MPKLNFWSAAPLALSVIAVVLSGAALLAVLGQFGQGASSSPQFEEQARAYLMRNPEIIVEAVQVLEERKEARAADELKSAVSEHSKEIFEDPASPVGGNPQGDVTLVEFFDYNCPYCRKAAPIMEELEKADGRLRIVYKEFPILGPGSAFAAGAALASQKQGKYIPFHKAMMAYSGSITEGTALEIAETVGLDVERLREDMKDPAISEAINRNLELADTLRIGGTPSFVVGDDVVRGLVDLATLQDHVAEAREHAEGAQ